MKRSQRLHLPRLRGSGIVLCLASTLPSCSSEKKAMVVSSVDECVQKTTLDRQSCEGGYYKAMAESRRVGPRYPDQLGCESEFEHCEALTDGQWFPTMEGFLVPQDEAASYHYNHHPIFRYYRPFSQHHNSFMLADGSVVGDGSSRNVTVSDSRLTSTTHGPQRVTRGGFGAIARAKAGGSGWGA